MKRWLAAAATKNRPVLSAPGVMAHRGATETASGETTNAWIQTWERTVGQAATASKDLVTGVDQGDTAAVRMGYASMQILE